MILILLNVFIKVIHGEGHEEFYPRKTKREKNKIKENQHGAECSSGKG